VGLDPLLQNKIYELLEAYKKKGTTIFFSSHNLPEVERVCDKVGIIKEGKLVEVASLKALEGKKLHKVEVRFNDKFKASDFKFDGVEKVEEISDGVILTVGGNVNPVIGKLAKHDLADIEISHASLEEVFLKFYEKKK
jgi:ABC-2 type transport system ATP-binding protein